MREELNNNETDGTMEVEASAETFTSPKEAVMEVSGKETETPVEVLTEVIETPEEAYGKPTNTLVETSMEAPAEAPNKPTETPIEASSETTNIHAETSNRSTKMPADTFVEPLETPEKALNKSESSGKKTVKSLKAKSKIGKSLIANNLKTNKNKGGPQADGKKTAAPAHNLTETPEASYKPIDAPPKAISKPQLSGKKKLKYVKVISNLGEKSLDVNNLKAKKNKGSVHDLGKKTDSPAEALNNPTKTPAETSSKSAELRPQIHGKGRKNKARESRSTKERNYNEQGGDGGLKSRKEKQPRSITKRDHGGESQRSGKKEKHGGLIFMCSGKTKPDCFHYRVMGISIGKKDIVLGIKPGMKLFLYDFDLKLLYGVYNASSSGGIKLEPKAFGGAFPAQVRFNVEKDCLPLPESVFRKAIKENYNEKNKFKTELTVRQVRKLTALFRPAEIHSSALYSRSSWDRKLDKEVRQSSRHSHGDKHGKDRYANDDARTYPLHYRERNHDVAATQREGVSRNLFMTEKEYRTYGLSGERSLTHPSLIAAHPLDPCQKDYEREHLPVHQNLIYREAVPTQKETHHADPFSMDDEEYQVYGVRARRQMLSATTMDSYAKDYYHRGSSVAPYSIESINVDPLRRRETDPVDRLYSKYDVHPRPSDRQMYQTAKLEPVTMPVSSRYSFPGPSYSYHS